VKNHRDVIQMIDNSGWNEPDERNRVIKKFFTGRPTIIKFLQRKFGFGSKKIVDIGCSYGHSLFYWGSESAGIDVNEHMSSLPKLLGYDIYLTNIEDRLAPDEWAGNFDGAYTDNLVEHLVAPHLFLLRINKILKPGGLLVIGHPTVPLSRLAKAYCKWRSGFEGYLASEHINFYTPETISLALKRAGFEPVGQWKTWRWFTLRVGPFSPHCFTVARKIEGWKYSVKRKELFDPSFAAEELKLFH